MYDSKYSVGNLPESAASIPVGVLLVDHDDPAARKVIALCI